MNPTIPTLPDTQPAPPPAPAEDEAARLASDQAWPSANRRRVALIRKLLHEGGLDAAEAAELHLLDAAADRRAAPHDRKMIERAEEVLRRAEGLRDASAP